MAKFESSTRCLLLTGCCLAVSVGVWAEAPKVTAVPESMKCDPFYKKYVDCAGLPILSSERVDDRALLRANELISRMLADRIDIWRTLVEADVRYVIIGANENTTDIPEYSHMTPKDYINERSRGFGGRITSCGEENLLCYAIDRYDDENILIHEFAHVIHGYGLKRIDKEFDNRLSKLYDKAMARGFWKNTYAASNRGEYWAEGVQSFYDANRQNNWNHNHVNTRRELVAYDPDLAKLIADTFRHTAKTDWRYEPVARQPQVTAPPSSLKCDPFFTKYVRARGFAILGSRTVSDEAMLEANYLIRHMFAYRHDILKPMIEAGVRLVVSGSKEIWADIPGYRELDMTKYLERARRGDTSVPPGRMLVCDERNLLDPVDGESMLIRRFAKAMYAVTGFRPVDEEFDKRPKQQYELRVKRMDIRFDSRLRKTYDKAMERGLWKNTSAATNRAEYWAEGVQSWFDCNGPDAKPRGMDDAVDTRRQLKRYDPELAELIGEVFQHEFRQDWRYVKPSLRKDE